MPTRRDPRRGPAATNLPPTRPQIRDALHHVSTARYGAALAALDRLRPSLTLDPQLAEQVGPLFQAARARALAQYAQPFSTLGLPAMAEAFGTDVG
jgi:COP9 signalosome complex subunit 1